MAHPGAELGMLTSAMDKVEVLECTLRDGSYSIDYQFTAEDTKLITAALADAGFRYIEIGHGIGLNASNCGKGEAAATDWEYIEAGAEAKGNSLIGMFFIPGIGRREDLIKAKKTGLDFVRIGTDIIQSEEAESYIKLAKDLGFFVSSNLMKTYVVEANEFLERALSVLEYGADIAVVVDSAGGMLPEDVRRYVSSLRKVTDKHIGFHGHNNLQLAIANTLVAIESGADFVDSTMQGMGRSAGNAQTEILVTILEEKGYHTGINEYKAMDVGDKLIVPLMRRKHGVDHIGVTSGLAKFHSGFMSIMERVAEEYAVDIRDLIIEVSKIEKVNVTEALAEEVAQRIKATKRDNISYNYMWNLNIGDIGDYGGSVENQALQIAREVKSLSRKTGKTSLFAFSFLRDRKEQAVTFPYIRQNDKIVAAFAEIVEAKQGLEIMDCVLSYVDFLAINASDIYRFDASQIDAIQKKKGVLFFDEFSAKLDSVFQLLVESVTDFQYIILWGANRLSEILCRRLTRLPVEVHVLGSTEVDKHLENALLDKHKIHVICKNMRLEATEISDIVFLPRDEVIFTSPTFMTTSFVSQLLDKQIQVLRLDIRAGLSGQLVTAMESWELSSSIRGSVEYEERQIIAGGVVGKRGDYVVDRIEGSTRFIGFADGEGGILPENLLTEEDKAAKLNFRRKIRVDQSE